jgi:hypothetical protein
MVNIKQRIRKLFKIRFVRQFDECFIFYSDHQTTPMMNGEHQSEKTSGHSSSTKVLL